MNVIAQQAMTPALGTHGSGSAPDLSGRRRAFRLLHDTGCFVVPNPWDVGSARYLQQLGFPGLATTRAGFAFSQGLPDSEHALTRDRTSVSARRWRLPHGRVSSTQRRC